MRLLLAIICLMFSVSVKAITIDEAGTTRPHKPGISFTGEIDPQSPQGLQDFQKLVQRAAQLDNALVIIDADLDGDGVSETIEHSGDPHENVNGKISRTFTAVDQNSQGLAERREHGSGLATGRRQHMMLFTSQTGLEGETGAVAMAQVTERAQVKKHIANVKYEELRIRLDGPSGELLAKVAKGWDGTVKGTSKRSSEVVIYLQNSQGREVMQVKLLLKGFGEVRVCSDSQVCGKTDHF